MESKKNTVIIVVCICCVLMTMIFACSKGCNKEEENKVVVVPPKNFTRIVEDEKKADFSKPKYSYSGGSSSYSSSETGNPPSLFTEEDKRELARSYEEDSKIIAELRKEWMENKLKDPDASIVAIEQIKLRSNPGFINGMKAFENGDYDSAIRFFNDILRDNNASPVSKYFACGQLMEVAMKKKDLDLYFIAARTRAKLESTEDLTILGINKNDYVLEWLDKVEYSLRAKKDPSYFDKCVELKLANRSSKKGDISKEAEELEKILSEKKGMPEAKRRELAITKVKKDIEFYSEKYKELIE